MDSERSISLSSSSDDASNQTQRSSSDSSFETGISNENLSALLHLGPERHPYSLLNELVQKNHLADLHFLANPAAASMEWTAQVSVTCPQLGTVSETAQGGSKLVAKRHAAEKVILRIQTELQSSLPPVPLSRAPDTSQVILTKKQQAVVARAQTHLSSLRRLAQIRGVQGRPSTFLSIDIEAYEKGSEILEVGVAWVKSSELWPIEKISAHHLIIRDHSHLHNGRFVADNRDRFNFGKSTLVAESQVPGILMSLFDEMTQFNESIVLVGHSIQNDVNWLKSMGVGLEKINLEVVDIGLAYQAAKNNLQLTKLEKMMAVLKIKFENLHNGGNDAVYSVQVLLQMMANEEEQRWDQINATILLL